MTSEWRPGGDSKNGEPTKFKVYNLCCGSSLVEFKLGQEPSCRTGLLGGQNPESARVTPKVCSTQACPLPSLISVGSILLSDYPRALFGDTRVPVTLQSIHWVSGHQSTWFHILHGRVYRVTWVYGTICSYLQPRPIRHPEAYQAPGSWNAAVHTGPLVSPQVLGWRPTLLAVTWHGYWKYPKTSGLGLVGTLPPSCLCKPQGS